MSVPEGKMRMDLVRTEVWLVASLLNDVMRDVALEAPGYHVGSEALRDLVRPILARMNGYLEATDGTPPAYVPHPATEAGVG